MMRGSTGGGPKRGSKSIHCAAHSRGGGSSVGDGKSHEGLRARESTGCALVPLPEGIHAEGLDLNGGDGGGEGRGERIRLGGKTKQDR